MRVKTKQQTKLIEHIDKLINEIQEFSTTEYTSLFGILEQENKNDLSYCGVEGMVALDRATKELEYAKAGASKILKEIEDKI